MASLYNVHRKRLIFYSIVNKTESNILTLNFKVGQNEQ